MISEGYLYADDDKLLGKRILGRQPHQVFFRCNQAPGTGSCGLRLNIFQILRRVAMMIRKFQKAAGIETEVFDGCLKFSVAGDTGETKDRIFYQSFYFLRRMLVGSPANRNRFPGFYRVTIGFMERGEHPILR